MGLHLSLYVLGDLTNLTAGPTTAMTRLDVIEHMELNRQLIDVTEHSRDQIGVVPVVSPQPILRGFMVEETGRDDHSVKFNADYYGRPLTWLYASDFGSIVLEAPDNEWASSARAQAALAYIAQLPPDTPVVLYWG